MLLLAGVGAVGRVPAAAAAPIEVSGTGATFPAKVYQQWAEQYALETGVKVLYKPSGSSAGVKHIIAREADFGATDVPMSPADLARHGLFQFPTVVGGIVPVVRLNADALAAIFAGQLTQWNDRRIRELNPGLSLPDLRITRVVRADGSGTTEVFVRYLHAVASTAAAAIEGQGGRAKWPGVTVGAEGSGKLVEAVKATPGAIGYVSSDYVIREGLNAVSLRNRSGEWVAPRVEAFGAAIRAGGLFKQSLDAAPLIDLDGPGVWPIVTATYVVVPRAPSALERAGRAMNFFYKSFLLGDKSVAGSGFAPLPTQTQARIVALLADFRTPSGQRVPVLS